MKDWSNVLRHYVTDNSFCYQLLQYLKSVDIEYCCVDTETYSLFKGRDALNPYSSDIRLLQLFFGSDSYVFDFYYVDRNIVREILEQFKYHIAHNASFECKFLQIRMNFRGNYLCSMIWSQVIFNGLRTVHGLKALCADELGIEMPKDQQASDWSQNPLTPEQLEYAAKDPWATYYLYFKLLEQTPDWAKPLLEKEMKLLPAVCQMELNGLTYDYQALLELEKEYKEEYETDLKKAQYQLPKVPPNKKYHRKKDVDELKARVKLEFNSLPEQLAYAVGYYKNPLPLTKKGLELYPTGWKVPETRDEMIVAFYFAGEPIENLMSYDKKSKKHKLALSKENYSKIQHSAVDTLENYNSKKKNYDSFIKNTLYFENADGQMVSDKLDPVTGKYHVSFKQCGTTTGRFSGDFQNRPRENRFRRLVKASPGYKIVKIDYDQIEFKIAAYICGCKAAIQAYAEGKDVHIIMACSIYMMDYADFFIDGKKTPNKDLKEKRQIGKNSNFGTIYDQFAEGLQGYILKNTGIKLPIKRCEDIVNAFFKTWDGFKDYHNAVKADIINCYRNSSDHSNFIYSIASLTGRKRFWPRQAIRIWERNGNYKVIANEQINMPVQSLCGEGVKDAIITLYENLLSKTDAVRLLLQVHDELVFEIREDCFYLLPYIEEVMVYEMQKYIPTIPVTVEATIGETWGG